jgi:hypothetical protein
MFAAAQLIHKALSTVPGPGVNMVPEIGRFQALCLPGFL